MKDLFGTDASVLITLQTKTTQTGQQTERQMEATRQTKHSIAR